jgi:hypothetical protein
MGRRMPIIEREGFTDDMHVRILETHALVTDG